MIRPFLSVCVSAFLLTGLFSKAAAAPLKTDQATFEIISSHAGVAPGGTITLGLHVALKAGWHIYWSNPGDSGAAPSVTFELPEGFSVEGPFWPSPKIIKSGPFTNYGYEGEVILPYKLIAAPDVKPYQQVVLRALLSSVVCKEDCIPFEASFAIPMDIVPERAEPTRWLDPLHEALRAVPKSSLAFSGKALVTDELISLNFPWNGITDSLIGATFLPKTEAVIKPNSSPTLIKNKDSLSLQFARADTTTKIPETINGILRLITEEKGIQITEDLNVTFSTIYKENSLPLASDNQNSFLTLLPHLGLAFIAGLILNLMPCVFPVISIKILGFLGKCGGETRKIRLHGVAFSAGVVVSFWVLAGLMIGLRSTGEMIGWGFQLQMPLFVYTVILVLFFWSLNLFGLFEVGGGVQQLAGSVKTNSRYSGSFLNGVLATFIATPCSAPFMGGAIALALTLSVWSSLLVFTSLGLGMAAPYMILCSWPALLNRLPKPGQWMVTFRQLMGFPLLLTIMWLLWVYGRQQGTDNLSLVLISLLFVSFFVYLFRLLPRKDKRGSLTRFAARLLVALTLIGAGLPFFLTTPFSERTAQAIDTEQAVSPWKKFSKARLKELLAKKQPVFVDFTASWCITCQVNEKLVLEKEAVLEAFAQAGITLMKADWTNADPEITETLESLGRNSVPVYALYESDMKPPYLFPSLLTQDMVIEKISTRKE